MRTLAGWQTENGPTLAVNFKDLDEQLRFLRSLITDYRARPEIRNQALEIVLSSGAASRDKKMQAIEIAKWVQMHVYYIHELPERFQTPTETLRLQAGDCDDQTSLLCSLLESIGIPTRTVTMKINGVWSHIFPAAVLPGGLLPLDTTSREPVENLVNPVRWATERGKTVNSLKFA